jgi:plasmid stabilization system protein ParE
MKRFKVIIAPVALDQIHEQVRYIARDSVDNALAWEDRVLAAIESLKDYHGHAVDENAAERVGGMTRRMVFEKTYLIHYEVNNEAGIVGVVYFRHGARLPKTHEP